MLVSFYKFTKSLKTIETVANFDEIIEMSINNQIPYGSWWELVNQYKEIDGIFFITYEELLEV